jgi:transcriptional regulator GlxA family with amidase domain
MDLDESWGEALERIVREAAQEDRSAPARVRALAHWIARDPARPHDVAALAERAAMSARSLERWFVRIQGMTPSRFVQAARLALARRLLDETSLPVKAIARRCGYGNEERMRRAFHRALGASPRRYAAALGASVPPNAYGLDVRFSGSNLQRSV